MPKITDIHQARENEAASRATRLTYLKILERVVIAEIIERQAQLDKLQADIAQLEAAEKS